MGEEIKRLFRGNDEPVIGKKIALAGEPRHTLRLTIARAARLVDRHVEIRNRHFRAIRWVLNLNVLIVPVPSITSDSRTLLHHAECFGKVKAFW